MSVDSKSKHCINCPQTELIMTLQRKSGNLHLPDPSKLTSLRNKPRIHSGRMMCSFWLWVNGTTKKLSLSPELCFVCPDLYPSSVLEPVAGSQLLYFTAGTASSPIPRLLVEAARCRPLISSMWLVCGHQSCQPQGAHMCELYQV